MTFCGVFQLLKAYRARIALIITLSLFISGISALTPFANQNMIDKGLIQGSIITTVHWAMLLLLLQLSSQVIEYIQRCQEIIITNRLGKKLKKEAFEHGLKLKPIHFREEGFYKTISDALYDISNILSVANSSFLTIIVVVGKCIGAAIGLVILDWRLSVFVVLIIPIKIWLNIIVRKRAEKYGQQLMEENKRYNSWFTNILPGVLDIKIWNHEKKIVNEYAEHVESINNSSKRLSLMTTKNNMIKYSLEYLLMYSLYILGALFITGGGLTFGGLIAFISFASVLLVPVNTIMDLRIVLKQIAPNVESLKKFNELDEECYDDYLPVAEEISTIEFVNVTVSSGERAILSDINLLINKGEKVAID